MTIAAFCLAYAGFAALCMAMDRHYEDIFERALPGRHRVPLRVVGAVALTLSLCAAATAYWWSYGVIEWIGMLALAGLALIWILTYRPRIALGLGAGCAVAAPVFAMM